MSLSPEKIQALLDGPGSPPPPGVISNFINPPTLRTETAATLIIAIVISTVFVAARIYTHRVVMQTMHWDDWSVLAGYVFFMAFCGECFVSLPVGYRHIWDERLSEVIPLLHLANTIEILYMPCITFIKTGIMLQYLRIFVPSRRQSPATFWAIIAVIVVNVMFDIIIMFFTIFTCSPREAIWNKLLPQNCFNTSKLLLAQAAFNLISDVVILLLPQYSIWRLHMTGRQKRALSALFGLGGIVCIVTALRVYSTAQLVQTQDATWYLAPTAMWAIAEVTLAIMCSCLPVVPKFFQSMTGGLSRKSQCEHSYSYGSRSRGSRSRSRPLESKERSTGRDGGLKGLKNSDDKSIGLPLHSPLPPDPTQLRNNAAWSRHGEPEPTWYNEFGSDHESQGSNHGLNGEREHQLAPRRSRSYSGPLVLSRPDRIVKTVHIELTHSGNEGGGKRGDF